MATRYENLISGWDGNDPNAAAILDGTAYPAFKQWYIDLLIAWHNQDPVSAKEIARNDSVYKIQNNRNPYIDHPEYVAAVWTPSGPQPEPSNYVTGFTASQGVPAYSAITLTWTDAAGPVVPSGYLIRASSIGYSNIITPVDGTPVASSTLDQNVGTGVQSCTFTGLASNTTYYFKIFPYSNAGSIIDYKTDAPVPAATATTTQGVSLLQPGDIGIIECSSTDPDKFSFVTFKQLVAGTVIRFTDNGFTNPTAVRTGEGFLVYTAPTVIAPGTVVSWYSGMNITGTGWNTGSPSGFAISTSGDQIFAYQGTWGTDQTMICGVNAGNAGWLTTGGATSNLSYLPASLTNEVNAVSFPEKNGYYNLITAGTTNVLGGLQCAYTNWVRSAAALGTPVWSYSLSNSTVINQDATIFNVIIGTGEIITVQGGITFTVTGDVTLY
jgi:hypothetical protein